MSPEREKKSYLFFQQYFNLQYGRIYYMIEIDKGELLIDVIYVVGNFSLTNHLKDTLMWCRKVMELP